MPLALKTKARVIRQHIHIIYKKNSHSVITTEKEVITAHAIIYSAQASHNIFFECKVTAILRMQHFKKHVMYGLFKNSNSFISHYFTTFAIKKGTKANTSS